MVTSLLIALMLGLQTFIIGLSLLTRIAAADGAISQSFLTSTANVAPGTLMSLAAAGGNKVEPATNTGSAKGLVGIAVNQPLVELAGNGQQNVLVAVGGTAEALVSDINGSVGVGDKITASPITGVGMKAVDTGQIVGTAQASLASVTTQSRTYTDRTGKANSVKVGLIPVSVNVEYYSASPSAATVSAYIPPILQNIANSVSGKQVSPLRVLIGALILLVGTITIVVMLGIAIRGGMISIGRNPLAERALRRGLLDVIIAAMGILLVSAVLVYAIIDA